MSSPADQVQVIDRTIHLDREEKAPVNREKQAGEESAASHPRPDVEVLNTLRAGARWSGAARLLIIVCLIGGGVGIYGGVERYYQPKPPKYRTQHCRTGDLVMTVAATGTLDPTNFVEIGCEMSGAIRTVEVDVNDPVRAGDLLFTLDTQELEAQVAKSRASLEVRQAELQHAEATLLESQQDLRRQGELRSARAGSEQEFDTATANLARAKANVSSSGAQVSVAQATLDADLSKLQKSRVYSPIDGIVLTRNVEPGQTVAATFQTPVLLTICEDLRSMKLKVDVDEADVGGVREGQAATFTVDAYPNESFPARITCLRYASRRVQDVVTYEAVLEVANEQLKLRPGMTAVADIITSKIQGALLIPNAALRFTPEDDFPEAPLEGDESPTSRVWIVENNELVPVPVTTGHTDGRYTEIKNGAVEDGMPLVVDVIP
jgi:HlyD family secretion protein